MTLTDPTVPAVSVLMGSDAGELLGAVLTEAGGAVRRYSISQVRYVPGRSITVQYSVRARWADGSKTWERMVATAGDRVPDGVPVFGADGIEIAVWRFPNDPFLPGLAAVHRPGSAARLLAQLGVVVETPEVRTRAYRAGRRAVLEVITPDARIFLKIVQPKRAAALQEIHARLVVQVPTPSSMGWSADQGIVALQALPGDTLRSALSAGGPLPGAAALIGLLDCFPPPEATTPIVPGPRSAVSAHCSLLTAVMPSLAPRLDPLEARLQADGPAGADAVHGDFHPSQVLVDGAAIVGVVDVDTAGAGHRVDDLASMVGFLAALGMASPSRPRLERYGAALVDEFDRVVDPHELRLGAAATILGLATGPFRVQEPDWEADTERRVALAEQWVASADAVR